MFLFYYYLFPIGFLLFVVHVVISLFGGWRLFNAISFIIHHYTCPPPRNSHDKFLFALPLAGPAVRASCFGTIDHLRDRHFSSTYQGTSHRGRPTARWGGNSTVRSPGKKKKISAAFGAQKQLACPWRWQTAAGPHGRQTYPL